MSLILFLYFIGFISLFLLFWQKIPQKCLKLILISAIYILFAGAIVFVPLIEQMLAHDIFTAAYNPHPTTLSLQAWLISTLTNFDMIGWIGLFCLLWSLFNLKKLTTFSKALLYSSIIFIVISHEIFPWSMLIKLPLLSNLQFTYRFFTYANLGIIYIFVFNFDWVKLIFNLKGTKINTKPKLFGLILVFNLITFTTQLIAIDMFKFHLPQVKAQKVSPVLKNNNEYLNMMHQDYTNKGYDYGIYLNKTINPKWFKELTTHRNEYVYDNKIVKVTKIITPDQLTIKFNTNNTRTTLMTPITLYKGLILKINGKISTPTLSKYKGIAINLPKNTNNIISFHYEYTFLARISQIVSLITILILSYHIIKLQHINNKQN